MVLASGEGFELHPNTVESVAWEIEQACSLKQVPYSCHKATSAITGGQPLWPHLIPSTSHQWPTSQHHQYPIFGNPTTCFQHVNFGKQPKREADNKPSKPHPVP